MANADALTHQPHQACWGDHDKVFEYVSRGRPADRGSRGDYPRRVIAASLAAYGFRRRLVYKGYVSCGLDPRRSIMASWNFATGGLWLICRDLTHKILKEYPSVIFGIHVDDLSYSREYGDEDKWTAELAQARERTQEGMRDEVELQVAHAKTAALAKSQSLADKLS